MQRRDEGDFGIARERVAQRQRPVRRQLGDEPFGQRLDPVALVAGFGIRGPRIAGDGDDGRSRAGAVGHTRHRHDARSPAAGTSSSRRT